jgi:peptidoglycan hydrolase-like protein with peptidoglycan-binding domain
MKKILLSLSVALIAVVAIPVSAETTAPMNTSMARPVCAALLRNLSLGSQGEDVRSLQKFLNLDNDTRIAVSGAGSVGNETTYLGPATVRAIIKFQEKYSTDILTPARLSRGNGFIGNLTRQKIARLCNVTIPTPHPVPPTPPVSNTNVTVLSPNGGEVLWKGTNGASPIFSWKSPDVIYIQAPRFDLSLIPELPACARTGTIRCMIAVVPIKIADNVIGSAGTSTYRWNFITDGNTYPTMPDGKYSLKVCFAGSETNCDTSDADFQIKTAPPCPTCGPTSTTPPTSATPTISDLSPSRGGSGSTVTVYGYNFTATNNLIKFGEGYAANVSSVAVLDTMYNTGTPTAGQYSGNTYVSYTLRSVTFTVPSFNTPACSFSPVNPCLTVQGGPTLPNGDYNVQVINANGTSTPAVFHLGSR